MIFDSIFIYQRETNLDLPKVTLNSLEPLIHWCIDYSDWVGGTVDCKSSNSQKSFHGISHTRCHFVHSRWLKGFKPSEELVELISVTQYSAAGESKHFSPASLLTYWAVKVKIIEWDSEFLKQQLSVIAIFTRFRARRNESVLEIVAVHDTLH